MSEPHRKLLDLLADTMIPETDTAGASQAATPQRLAAMHSDWASDETRSHEPVCSHEPRRRYQAFTAADTRFSRAAIISIAWATVIANR